MKEFGDKVIVHWQEIAPLLMIRNEGEYDAAIKRLNKLLDEIGTNEKHPLYSFLDILGPSFTPMKKNTTIFLRNSSNALHDTFWRRMLNSTKGFLVDDIYSL